MHLDCLLAIEALGIFQDVFVQDLLALRGLDPKDLPPVPFHVDVRPEWKTRPVWLSADKTAAMTPSSFTKQAKMIATALGWRRTVYILQVYLFRV